ncbi:hypothetical protein GOO02_004230 [Salmonella enterica]|uniref:Uncharacterized protein n=1 Tax=Salmonella typhimurium TaxID=90371 RepID=A0A627GUG5_SALTM|nr:hypothetical protein [Salmonella enterica subsp. enterica serovar Typhimurium]EAV3954865.1 hypothetical protein [Salmonella enterica]EGX2077072.1 hypothetical protein [Salmonella enterica subsp. enterica serovar Enteritidis]EBB1887580.1 hypothetical protein [Salmonella enterica]EBB6832741.1 hypothetical protein [Salmonella enterica]
MCIVIFFEYYNVLQINVLACNIHSYYRHHLNQSLMYNLISQKHHFLLSGTLSGTQLAKHKQYPT